MSLCIYPLMIVVIYIFINGSFSYSSIFFIFPVRWQLQKVHIIRAENYALLKCRLMHYFEIIPSFIIFNLMKNLSSSFLDQKKIRVLKRRRKNCVSLDKNGS